PGAARELPRGPAAHPAQAAAGGLRGGRRTAAAAEQPDLVGEGSAPPGGRRNCARPGAGERAGLEMGSAPEGALAAADQRARDPADLRAGDGAGPRPPGPDRDDAAGGATARAVSTARPVRAHRRGRRPPRPSGRPRGGGPARRRRLEALGPTATYGLVLDSRESEHPSASYLVRRGEVWRRCRCR